MSLSDEARQVPTLTGVKAALVRLMEALPDDEAAEVWDLLMDDTIGHHQVRKVLIRHYGDHPVFGGKPISEQQVSGWRLSQGVRLR